MTGRLRWVSPALVAGLLLTGCGTKTGSGGTDVLTGRVTLNGQPVKDVTVVATGPDRNEASALTGANGEYRLAKPPRGALQFRVTALVPPPPPGVNAPPPGSGTGGTAIPPRYAKPGNGLSFDYEGGRQTYDIALNS